MSYQRPYSHRACSYNDNDSEEQAKAGFNQFMEDLGAKYPEMVPWWMDYVSYPVQTYASLTMSCILVPSFVLPVHNRISGGRL